MSEQIIKCRIKEELFKFSLADSIIKVRIDNGGTGHTHDNLALLDSLHYIEEYRAFGITED